MLVQQAVHVLTHAVADGIRERVVQGALKLILEPVFEADFQPGSYGYRPKRSAHEAVNRVAKATSSVTSALTKACR